LRGEVKGGGGRQLSEFCYSLNYKKSGEVEGFWFGRGIGVRGRKGERREK